MLTELRIRDFAVVEDVAIEFGPGLNVLTGETGAGKSIIVDALTAALGARTASDVIRTGASAATVEARFEPERVGPASRWLRNQGLDDHELVVAREIAAEGRSRGWINGRPATVAMLRDLGDHLIEVAGQHEGQRLLRPSVHLDLLDAFGGPAVSALRAEVAGLVRTRAALRSERVALVAGERERFRQNELLTHQIQEIDAARLQPGEEEDLASRRLRLVNAERLASSAQAAYGALYEADGRAAVDLLGRARTTLRDLAALDPVLAEVAQRLEAMGADLADVAHALARYAAAVETRPDELAAVDDRLDLLRSLKRKYGDTLEAVLRFRDEAAATLATVQRRAARVAEIAAALQTLEDDLAARCARLTSLRREAAGRLEAEVERTLRALEMGRTRFIVDLARDPDDEGLAIGHERLAVHQTGVDRVEFLFAPNPGEAPRPLARIASGGELSRIMLALRHALAEAGAVPVLVCDEVDAGVGSRTAGAVGQLLASVARNRQVLCVTHLPQIASLADRHFWVTKETDGGRTRVRVSNLDADERVEEVARMLGGRKPTAIAREHAVELLSQARPPAAGRAPARGARGGKP